jgi:hypothetical protein
MGKAVKVNLEPSPQVLKHEEPPVHLLEFFAQRSPEVGLGGTATAIVDVSQQLSDLPQG